MTIPVDDGLLEPLGRVQQAAARLHAAVRDATNQLTGQRRDLPLDTTLADAVRGLETRVRTLPDGGERTRLLGWIHEQAMPAADRRTRVTVARVAVAEDGTLSLHDDATGEDIDAGDLLEVADQLTHAARSLPLGPHDT